MALSRSILAGIALAATAVVAQGPCKGTARIQNSGDATALSACAIYQGDVVIQPQTAGAIALDGIQRITGSLSCDGAVNLTSLSANDLSVIDKEFALTGLTVLSTLSMPSLQTVDTISWVALPALQQLTFNAGVTEANNVTISNTELNSLDGITLHTVDVLNINNNPYLNQISMPLTNLTTAGIIAANGRNLQVNFPNLEFAFNMSFRDCSSIDLSSLKSVNGSLGFYENSFGTFTAANLTTTGQDLVFDNNEQLTNISLPKLTFVGGGFQIANNTEVRTIDGFPKLKRVGGALDYSGNFTSVSLPSITEVDGGWNMQSSGNLDCSAFDKLEANGDIRGKYVCSGAVAKPGTAGTTPTTTGSGSSSSHSGIAGHFDVSAQIVLGSAVFAAGMVQMAL